MKASRRAKRMQRRHRRKLPELNLVSLMDIFTILVFFLLASSSNTQQLPNSKDLELPESISDKAPEENLIVMITPKAILVQGMQIISIDSALALEGNIITELKEELEFQSKKRPSAELDATGRPITIMGDANIPYKLLRKILATCRQANYIQIAFVAWQTSADNGGS